MFIKFFYFLRGKGLAVSLNEWLCLIEALDKGLARNSLMEFYSLCKNILIKSEADYDKFDLAFAEYFQGIKSAEDIPEELWNWLSTDERERDLDDMPPWAKAVSYTHLRSFYGSDERGHAW